MIEKLETAIAIETTSEQLISISTNPKMPDGWLGVKLSFIELKFGRHYSLVLNGTEPYLGFMDTGILKEYTTDPKLTIDNFIDSSLSPTILRLMELSTFTERKNSRTELYLYLYNIGCQRGWDWYCKTVKEVLAQVIEKFKRLS